VLALLRQSTIIDFDLVSDKLGDILAELCSLITTQSEEIADLKAELANRALKSDVTAEITEETAHLNALRAELAEQMTGMKGDLSDLQVLLSKSKAALSEQVDEMGRNCSADTERRVRDLKQEIVIMNQQIKETRSATGSNTNAIGPLTDRITSIETMLEEGKKTSIDVLARKIERLDSGLADMIGIQSSRKMEVDAQFQVLAKQTKQRSQTVDEELGDVRDALKDLRHLLMSAPEIETNGGLVDTEALVRAIQRDSRRIDGFNLTMVGVRDDNVMLRALFAHMSKAIEQVQLHLLDFVKDSNRTKAEVAHFSREMKLIVDRLSTAIIKGSHDTAQVLDVTQTGMNSIVGTIGELFAFLGKITTRPLPVAGSFDDMLHELHSLSEMVSAQNVKYDEQQKADSFSPVREIRLNDNFKIPFVDIPEMPPSTVPGARGQEAAARAALANSTTGKNTIDFELRAQVSVLEEKLQKVAVGVNEFKDGVEAKIRGKSDTLALDRVMEKMRADLSKMREEVLRLERSIGARVHRDEAEKLIQHVILEVQAGGDTAAGSHPVECLLCGRPKSAVSPNTLPVLDSPGEFLFGKTREKSKLSPTRPSTGQRTHRLPAAFSGPRTRAHSPISSDSLPS
jgi:hypothetical protein